MGRGIAVLDEGPRCAREGEVLGFLFFVFKMENAIGSLTVKCFRFKCENLIFPFGKRMLESSIRVLFGDIFTFKIKVGVYEKLAKK